MKLNGQKRSTKWETIEAWTLGYTFFCLSWLHSWWRRIQIQLIYNLDVIWVDCQLPTTHYYEWWFGHICKYLFTANFHLQTPSPIKRICNLLASIQMIFSVMYYVLCIFNFLRAFTLFLPFILCIDLSHRIRPLFPCHLASPFIAQKYNSHKVKQLAESV